MVWSRYAMNYITGNNSERVFSMSQPESEGKIFEVLWGLDFFRSSKTAKKHGRDLPP